MPKYKILKNIARNFAHSFMSMMNFEEGFYITDVIAREMYLHKLSKVEIDFLGAEVSEEQVRHPIIMMSVDYYSREFFPQMLEREGFEKEIITSARLYINYLFEDYKDNLLPYRVIMILIDDNGKSHTGELVDEIVISPKQFMH